MKFVYEYRTSDNVIHRGEVNASSRDTAFRKLRQSGIRPARLEESAGFFNKLFGKGKRWIAIGLLVLVAGFLAFRVFTTREKTQSYSSIRHQIYGDPALMEELELTEYASVFALEGERMLAKFAQPGIVQQFKGRDWRVAFASELDAVLTNQIMFVDGERREIRELKQIVNGMKDELRRYLANGNGTTASYVRRLLERQEREFRIYASVKLELEKEEDQEKWQRRNDELRALGLMTVPLKMPADDEDGSVKNLKKFPLAPRKNF